MSTRRRLGVIGCGNIGRAVVANLIEDGHHVSVYDASADRLPPLVGLGARSADSPAKVAERVERHAAIIMQ